MAVLVRFPGGLDRNCCFVPKVILFTFYFQTWSWRCLGRSRSTWVSVERFLPEPKEV